MTQKMCESLGFKTVSYDTIKVWFQKFKAGNFGIEDEQSSSQLQQITDQDRHFSTQTMVLQFDV